MRLRLNFLSVFVWLSFIAIKYLAPSLVMRTLRKQRLEDTYVRVIYDIYRNSKTLIRVNKDSDKILVKEYSLINKHLRIYVTSIDVHRQYYVPVNTRREEIYVKDSK